MTCDSIRISFLETLNITLSTILNEKIDTYFSEIFLSYNLKTFRLTLFLEFIIMHYLLSQYFSSTTFSLEYINT